MRQALGNASRASAIARLLDLGALKTEYAQVTLELLQSAGDKPAEAALIRYRTTPFGSAIFKEGIARILPPAIISMLGERFQNETKDS